MPRSPYLLLLSHSAFLPSVERTSPCCQYKSTASILDPLSRITHISCSIPCFDSIKHNLKHTNRNVSLLITKETPPSLLCRGGLCRAQTSVETLPPLSPPWRSRQIVLHFCHPNLETSEQRICRCSQNEPELLQTKRTCGCGAETKHEILSVDHWGTLVEGSSEGCGYEDAGW